MAFNHLLLHNTKPVVNIPQQPRVIKSINDKTIYIIIITDNSTDTQ